MNVKFIIRNKVDRIHCRCVLLLSLVLGIQAIGFAQSTADLNSRLKITPVAPYRVEWYNDSAILPANLVTDPSAAIIPGIYYSVLVDTTDGGNCVSKASAIRFTTNICPAVTVDLRQFIDSTEIPADNIITYHTTDTASNANRLNDTIIVAATTGTYYVAFFDTVNACYSNTNPIVVTLQPCSQNIFARVYLDGSLQNNGGATASDGRPLMRDDLRNSPYNNNNYIPLKDPYSFATTYFDITTNYSKVGPGLLIENQVITDSASVFGVTGENAIVDWIFVELRNKNNNTQVVATRAGLVQRDGDVVDLDGVSPLSFSDIAVDSYFVAIRHRNHLGVMTMAAQTPEQQSGLLDFTRDTLPLFDYGTSITPYDYSGLATNNNLIPGYRALWAGDFDGNGRVKFDSPNDDVNILLFDAIGFPENTESLTNYDLVYGYFQGDFNMNAKCKFESPEDDTNLLFFQIMGYPVNQSSDTNFDLFIQQLPH